MEFQWIREIDNELKEKFSKILPSEILNLFLIDNFYLVFYSWDNVKVNQTRNVLKVDMNFRIIWQIEDYQWLEEADIYRTFHYTGASIKDGALQVRNYCGVILKLDFETGQVTRLPGLQRAY